MGKVGCVAVLLMVFMGYSFAKNISWIGYNIPPYHILDGKNKGKGIADFMYEEFKKAFKDHKHDIRFGNITRTITEMLNMNVNSCAVGGFKLTPLELSKRRVWSKVVFREPPFMLVVRAETFKAMGKPTSIALDKFLSDPTYTFGHFRNRIYNHMIDEVLKKYQKNKNFFTISTAQGSMTILKMIGKKRLDSGIFFPTELGYIKMSLGSSNHFESIPLEGVDTIIPVFANCTNNAWGREKIERINKLIDANFKRKVGERYKTWLVNSNSLRAFEKANADLWK